MSGVDCRSNYTSLRLTENLILSIPYRITTRAVYIKSFSLCLSTLFIWITYQMKALSSRYRMVYRSMTNYCSFSVFSPNDKISLILCCEASNPVWIVYHPIALSKLYIMKLSRWELNLWVTHFIRAYSIRRYKRKCPFRRIADQFWPKQLYLKSVQENEPI
jgi:hypothetical protein